MKKLLYFLIIALFSQQAIGQILDSARRKVNMSGAINFRDLGGYTTRDGHHVKWAKIYRSADLSKLSDSDLLLMQNLKITYDVDLRGTEESSKAPDHIPSGIHYQLCPAGSQNLGEMMKSIASAKTSIQGDSIMMVYYGTTTFFKDRYKPFFNTLLELPQGQSLVFHCTAGKDRTGIGAALLLYALGVPYETIIQDFEASNYYRMKENDKARKGMVNYMHINDEVAGSILSVKKEYMDTTFEAIKKQYGSVDHFLSSEIGLDKSRLKILKAKFLE